MLAGIRKGLAGSSDAAEDITDHDAQSEQPADKLDPYRGIIRFKARKLAGLLHAQEPHRQCMTSASLQQVYAP